MRNQPPLTVIFWVARCQQKDLSLAIAHYGYPRLKPLLDILMEKK